MCCPVMYRAVLHCVLGPAVQALGLDEGHAVCQALQDVKLAVNTGSYGPLESASGAVAVCVLADWFEVFTEVSNNHGAVCSSVGVTQHVLPGLPVLNLLGFETGHML